MPQSYGYSVSDIRIFRAHVPGLTPQAAKERARQNYCLAKLFAQAGMKDRAIEHLRRALDEGFSDHKVLMQDREFASLRNTAEFAQLMAEKNVH
jgi:hypothetical protein